MFMQSAPLADDDRAPHDDAYASTSARFRLKMTPDGQLVPEIVPVGDDATKPQRSSEEP